MDDATRDQMLKAVETAQAAQKAQSVANDLRSRAEQITDPDKRDKMLQEAIDKETEASGFSKTAKRLQSGTVQGFGFGGGIGAATGLGLGAGIGTLISTIAVVPTTAIGMLVGAGVGAIHGPWIKLGGKEQKFEDADPKDVVDAIEQEQISHGTGDTNPTVINEAPRSNVANNAQEAFPSSTKRKPKKLEVRSQKTTTTEQQRKGVNTENNPRRKPKKLEVRSAKKTSAQ